MHFWHSCQGSEAKGLTPWTPRSCRSQHTLSKTGPLTCEDLHLLSSTIRPPMPAVLTSRSTPVAPGQTWSQTGGGAGGRNTPESPPHLSPPYSCCTLPSSSQRWDGYTGKHLAAAPPPWCLRLGPVNGQSCPPNIWERRWWGCGKNGCLKEELVGEHARTNQGQLQEDRHPERVTQVADHEIRKPTWHM